MDVFFYEAFAEEAKALKELLGDSITYDLSPQTIQESGHSTPPARIISIRTQSVVPESWADNIEGILSRSTGYDHLASYLTAIKKPLPCGYLEEYATRAVAEQAIMLMMALLRKLPQQTGRFSSFNRDGLTGRECAGKNLLIVGVGRIGGEIASIARGLGVNIKGVDPVVRHPHIDYVDQREGIRWADVVICAMNLTPENTGYFSYDLLRHGKKGILLINIARGEHTPAADLLRLLREERLGGLGLDVYENEPAVAFDLRNHTSSQSREAEIIREMMNYPNVIFTPHNAFNTLEALRRKAQFTVQQVIYFLENHDFKVKLVPEKSSDIHRH